MLLAYTSSLIFMLVFLEKIHSTHPNALEFYSRGNLTVDCNALNLDYQTEIVNR